MLKRLGIAFALLACLGLADSPVFALPPAPHTQCAVASATVGSLWMSDTMSYCTGVCDGATPDGFIQADGTGMLAFPGGMPSGTCRTCAGDVYNQAFTVASGTYEMCSSGVGGCSPANPFC